ncbi:3,4-dihydroxy-2-butanone-4-phosphate synthase [Shigella flexneri]
MALTIRHGSGIVCLRLTTNAVSSLIRRSGQNNFSQFKTGFTVTIEAAHGADHRVSAADRITTIRAAVAHGAVPADLNSSWTCVPAARAEWRRLTCRGHTEKRL